MANPTFDRIQYVDDTTQEIFFLGDDEAVEVGEFVALDGSTYKNYWMPQIKAYSDATGEAIPLGLATKKIPAKLESGDELFRFSVIRDHERPMGLMKAGRAYMMNTGSSTVNPGDSIGPCVTGFQKATGNIIVAGAAEGKIARGAWGFIHVLIK